MNGNNGNIRQTYIRIPEELHRDLRILAAEEDVSLNTLFISLLTEAKEVRRASSPTLEHNK